MFREEKNDFGVGMALHGMGRVPERIHFGFQFYKYPKHCIYYPNKTHKFHDSI